VRAELLQSERLRDFIDFCRKHRKEIDDSYICDEDLEEFLPGDEYPAYVVTNEKLELIAAVRLC
jgi:mycothiol synthase